jgi:hypothetical protein
MATTTNNGWTTPNDTDLVKDGALAIRTLGNGIDTSVGVGLLPWVAWTPVLGGVGWSLGTTGSAAVGYYCKIGKTVHFTARLTFGTAGATFSAVNRPSVTLPVTATAAAGNVDFVTSIAYYDSSATLRYLGSCDFQTAAMSLFCWNSAGTYLVGAAVINTAPFTWAASDEIHISGTYEAA